MKRSIFDSIFVKPKHVWEEANFVKSQSLIALAICFIIELHFTCNYILVDWIVCYVLIHFNLFIPWQMFFEITLKVALQTKKINIEKNKKYRKNA